MPFWMELDVELPLGAAVPSWFGDQEVVHVLVMQGVCERRHIGSKRSVGMRSVRPRVVPASRHDLEFLMTRRPGVLKDKGRGTVKQSGVVARCRGCGAAGYALSRWPDRPSARKAFLSAAAEKSAGLLDDAFGRDCDEVTARVVLGL